MPAMVVLTSAKSRLDDAGDGDDVRDALDGLAEDVVGDAGRIRRSLRPFATASSFSLGMTMRVSTASSSSCRPRSACIMRRLPSKEKGRVTTATVRAPHLAGEGGDDWGGACSGSATEAGGDEDHVRAFKGFDDLVGVLEGGAAANVWVGAGSEAAGEA